MSKKFWLFLVVALSVIVALVYFFKPQNQPEQPAQTSILTEMTPAPCPYDGDFCRYLAAQATALQKGIVMDMTNQATSEERVETNIRLDGAGNMMVQTFIDGKFTAGITTYAGLTYVLDLEDQGWYVLPDSMTSASSETSFIDTIKNSYDPDFNQSALTVALLGEEPCEQATCFKYELINQVGDAGAVSKIYLWIDKSIYLATKMEIINESNSMLATYRYEEVRISKPDPIKEMPKLVFPGEMGASDQGESTSAANGIDADDLQSKTPAELEQMMQEYALDR